jgi:hypothetical protein
VEESIAVGSDHAGLLRPFLTSRFRSRYSNIEPGSKRRSELYNKLCHRYHLVLDWRYAEPIPESNLERELRKLGAALNCYCFCASEELDGHGIPLGVALSELIGHGLPVLLVCSPGRLAYFQPEYVEGASQRYILMRLHT